MLIIETDYLFVLVRIYGNTTKSRGIIAIILSDKAIERRSPAIKRFQKMGRDNSINHPSHSECHLVGTSVHLPT